MKKDLINFAKFLIENCDDCFYRDGTAVIVKGGLNIELTSDKSSPEYIKIMVKNYYTDSYGFSKIKEIASQTVTTENAKDLINNFWKKVSLNSSKNFIKNYGLEKYEFYASAYLSALEGIKEDENFIFERKLNKDYLELIVKNKFNTNNEGYILSIPLESSFVDFQYRIHSALVLEPIIPCADNEKYMPETITICLPTINLDSKYNPNNDLKISTNIRYSEDNIIEYISSELIGKEEKNLLMMFDLENDLNSNYSNNKKLKI